MTRPTRERLAEIIEILRIRESLRGYPSMEHELLAEIDSLRVDAIVNAANWDAERNRLRAEYKELEGNRYCSEHGPDCPYFEKAEALSKAHDGRRNSAFLTPK